MTIERVASSLFVFVCSLCVVMTMLGGFLHFSSIPYWDMWDGYINYYMRLSSGDLSSIWSQHNEHRIVLSRILFFVDIQFFGGEGHFLITLNYLFMFCSVLLFSWLSIKKMRGALNFSGKVVLVAALTAWLFLWTQWNNITWAFQSQFFLAQILPLSALIALAIHKQGDQAKHTWFWAAIALGVLSCGAMANGLLALPALVVAGIILRLPAAQISITSIAACVCFVGYFYGYISPASSGAIGENLMHNGLEILRYSARYLGSPFSAPIGGVWGLWAAELAGFVLLFAASVSFYFVILGKIRNPLDVSLVIFVGFVIASAVITAAGRIEFGITTATSSRYTTPAIMAWAALLCVFVDRIVAFCNRRQMLRFAALGGLLSASTVILNYQLNALKPDRGALFSREVAVLSIELGFSDSEYTGTIFPDKNALLEYGKRASARDISVFGARAYNNIAEQIGTQSQTSSRFTCRGSIDLVSKIEDSDKFIRIIGWQFDSTTRSRSKALYFVDRNNKIVGYGLSGMERKDVSAALNDKRALLSGFVGYVSSDFADTEVFIKGRDIGCQSQLPFPADPA